MALRLFLDSADPADWRQWLPSGLFHGVTTNPTLLKRAGQPCDLASLRALSQEALALGVRELHLQAWGSDLLSCGRALADLAPGRIWIKLPITRAGVEAARGLLADGLPITFTACYEPAQVLPAVALGVDYIAPYLGRISDLGRDGHPARGGFLPPVPLANRMWAGGRVRFLAPVRIGGRLSPALPEFWA